MIVNAHKAEKRKGRKIETFEQLVQLVKTKRSVICKNSEINNDWLVTSAAYILSRNGTIIVKYLDHGLYLYKKIEEIEI